MLTTHVGPMLPRIKPHFQTEALIALATGETFRLPSPDRLYPGHVLVTGPTHMHRAVVLSTQYTPSRKSIQVTRRPLMGGSDITTAFRVGTPVKVSGMGFHDQFTPELIPSIPLATVPDQPQEGDRIWIQSAVSTSATAVLVYTFKDGIWQTPGRGPRRSNERAQAAVLHPNALRENWFVYQSAATRPHLYADGIAYPAKRIADLQPGDILREPGGARHTVTEATHNVPCQEDKVHLTLRPDELSAYPWGNPSGLVKGWEASLFRRREDMVPVLPSRDDYTTASAVRTGDQFIDTFGRHVTATETEPGCWTGATGIYNFRMLDPHHDGDVTHDHMHARPAPMLRLTAP